MRQESHAPRCAGRSRSRANEPRRTDRHDAPRSGGSRLSKSLGLLDDCVERLIERFPGNHDRRAMPLDQFLRCFPALGIEIRDEALWPIDLDDGIAPGTHGLRCDPAYALPRHPSLPARTGDPRSVSPSSSISRTGVRSNAINVETTVTRPRKTAIETAKRRSSQDPACQANQTAATKNARAGAAMSRPRSRLRRTISVRSDRVRSRPMRPPPATAFPVGVSRLAGIRASGRP